LVEASNSIWNFQENEWRLTFGIWILVFYCIFLILKLLAYNQIKRI
jgi:hypothetical protein